MERRLYIISGQVQGVGFRPFVYRSALACGLTGSVGNTSEGVRIEAQGEAAGLDAFEGLLATDAPPLARIVSLSTSTLPVAADEKSFIIAASEGDGHRGHAVLISPDMAVCDACLADMLDPANRRHGYAFTNCTDCGPRYTITRSIPYDRPFTSMACFPLCDECRREYEDPLDRRFHAQPNACPVCGPALWLEYGPRCGTRPTVRGNAAVPALLDGLRRGLLAAVKGLGGFHLACDAFNPDAIGELRRRKNRPHKALAVMTADVESARSLAFVSSEAEAALLSPRRPIVICPRRPGALPAALAPDTSSIGLVLPYAPLHHLLFRPGAAGGAPDDALRALVMTSGNAGGEPICLGNREAKTRLAAIADLFLFHNRDILVRVDDSVLFAGEEASGKDGARAENRAASPTVAVRRARGFVPEPLLLSPRTDKVVPSVFAAGADLKHTFCLTRGREAFVSQHIGDLSRPGCLDFFEETLRHLLALLEVEPRLVVRDPHPDYASGRLAEAFAHERGLPVFSLQHHFAHIHAVLAEHGRVEAALGLALDGSGLGEDGTVWGGELLFVHPEADAQRRLGRLSPFPLPGGEAAIREPWRTAEALGGMAGAPDAAAARPWVRDPARAAMLPMLREMLNRGVNCPLSSSCGRVFDAVAALCGLCFAVTYEGQAAVLLEEAQDRTETGAYALPLLPGDGGLLEADAAALYRAAAEDRARGAPVGRVARRFHRGLAEGLAEWARAAADECGVTVVALGGGVLNNRTLAAELPVALRKRGLTPLLPLAYPAGDGSIALGQAAWGRLRKGGENGKEADSSANDVTGKRP